MRILDRYILRELLGPFLIGILGFVLVMTVDLLFTMADLIINKGVPLWAMLRLLAYKLPSIMVLTFPVSTLFAAAMALGRLSKDNEITALRTSGIHLLRISLPILALGIAVSLLAYITNEKIVPYTNHQASTLIRQVIYKKPLPEVKENVFFKDAYNRFYYARRIDMEKKLMTGVMVYEVADEKFPRVILADEASFSGKEWELKKGVVHKFDQEGRLNWEASFDRMNLSISEDVLDFAMQKTCAEMDSKEIKDKIVMLDRGGVRTDALRTELLLKYSIPATCFVFALVAIPFSLTTPRAGRTWGMVMTIVMIFTFYVFASVFRSLGVGGLLSPLLAAFTPQATFIMIGGILLFREACFK